MGERGVFMGLLFWLIMCSCVGDFGVISVYFVFVWR